MEGYPAEGKFDVSNCGGPATMCISKMVFKSFVWQMALLPEGKCRKIEASIVDYS